MGLIRLLRESYKHGDIVIRISVVVASISLLCGVIGMSYLLIRLAVFLFLG